MEYIWITLGIVFILAGIIGSLLPVIPGPPLGYAGLLLLLLTPSSPYGITFYLFWGFITVIAVSLEHLVPAVSAGKMGATKFGIWGCLAGGVIGFFFFPPFGIIFGPMIGAYAGEIIAGQNSGNALRAATGSFFGFFIGTVIKVAVSLTMAYYFFKPFF